MPDLLTVVFLAVLSLLLSLGGFGWWLANLVNGPRARLKRRAAAVAGGRAQAAATARGPRSSRRAIQARIDAESRKRRRAWAWTLREQLRRAGLKVELRHYLAANAGLAALAALFAWAGHLPPIAMPLLAAIVGLGLPKMAVSILAERRANRFTAQFAEALDVIVRGLRTGLPLGECIAAIGNDMPPPLGAEFRLIAENQRLGLSLTEALDRAVENMPTADFKYFGIVLAIQQQTGGNLAETLAKLADVLRARKRMRDKIRAFSAEAKASACIIGSLPIVVAALMFLVGRDYVMLLFVTELGRLMLAVGAVMMVAGALVMRRMIDFDM